MTRAAFTVAAAALVFTAETARVRGQDPPDPQRPVFRAGAHYVRVDAYPVRNGVPIANLTAGDFEVLEDGTPQRIETFEFVEHAGRTPQTQRSDPNSQRDAFLLASDPQYRIFVLYLDVFNVDLAASRRLSVPITEMLSRMLGPRDLIGLLTPVQSPRTDLMLGSLSQTIEEQFTRNSDWGLADRRRFAMDRMENELLGMFPGRRGERLVALRRLDKVYADLEELVSLLGELRDERKNIIFFSNAFASPTTLFSTMMHSPDGRAPGPPPIRPGSDGKLTMGRRNPGDPDRRALMAEEERLNSIDFLSRFRELLRNARQQNVAFYTVRPGGLDPNASLLSEALSNLESLAEQTDGLAITHTNDLRAGLSRIATDISSHYVLGYYTSNTNWDGRSRRIAVRLKATGERVRARSEYRAPTEADMAAIVEARAAGAAAAAGPSPIDTALGALALTRPGAPLHFHGAAVGAELSVVTEIPASAMEAGRWKQGADVRVMLTSESGRTLSGAGRIRPGARGVVVRIPVGSDPGPWQAMVRVRAEGEPPHTDTVAIARTAGTVLGPPTAFRAAAPASSQLSPVAVFHFRRTERIRVEWPVLQPLTARQARVLSRVGQPLAVPVVLTDRTHGGQTFVAADVNFSPLVAGDYLIELTATSGSATARELIAVRVANAR
jgi:VWFA-related protein